MRIHSVSMAGFGPYRDRVEVDFDAFADDGIFLLTGRTGAGKSSVLDALTYGLFGTVPRYDGKIDEAVRSRYLAPGVPTEVTVELTVAETRYRVWRSPAYRRPKKVGTGTTPEKARIELSRLGEAGFEVFETKIGNAETHVQELLGLDAHQFLQVVLLAQGQFQEFLVAKSETRRQLLRRLFGTQRFDTYSSAVQDRARAAKQQLEHVLTTISAKAGTLAQQSGTEAPPTDVVGWAEQVVADQQEVVSAASARAEADRLRLAAVDEAFHAARITAERQQRRAEALRRQAELAEQQHEVTAHRQTVAAARRAVVAHQAVGQHRRAAEAAADAEAAHDAALADLAARLPEQGVELEAVRRRADELAEEVGALGASVELERRLPDLRQRAAASSEAVAAFGHDLEHRGTERDLTTHRIDEVRLQLEATTELGAQHASATADLERLRERQSRAAEADRLEQRIATATREQLTLTETANRAETALLALRRRQLDGYSAVLAAQLADGEPCLVCGATDHPHPARPTDDHVEEADLDLAAQAESTGREAAGAATSALERLRTSFETAVEQAGGTTAELTTAVEAATEALTGLGRELGRRAALEAEAKALRTTLDQLDRQLAASAVERERLAGVAVAAAATLGEAEQQVADARGDAVSVEAVRGARRGDLAAVRAVAEAVERLQECRAATVEATGILQAALDAGGFASAEEVETAVVATAEVTRLDQLVARHDAALTAVASILAEPELADLPAEPVDVEAPRAQLVEAKRAATASGEERATQQGRLEAYASLTGEIAAAVTASAAQLARYETVAALDKTLRGMGANQLRMPLETFALVAELEDILGAANVRLASMTGGRYELQYSDDTTSAGISGLEIAVLDAHTGDTRSPSSLSGGEKFQASLALALGLAEVVTSRAGGLRLDTLFIDEGFGSLDPETLEVTMETLDALREGGRTIGLISHVEAMKEQIPAQVRVERTTDGSSTIRTSA
ncbi:SMC family ATPase [Aeromicrobium sp. Sec7.5]|uniref:SMC family ATPase n=1 Tax=Aeromicrobium sp. Sec7.5 TaxID=3121276 RepID=UPI002FE4DE80